MEFKLSAVVFEVSPLEIGVPDKISLGTTACCICPHRDSSAYYV